MVRNEHRYRRPHAAGAEKLLAERAYLHEAQRLGQVGSWAFNTPSGYLLRIFGYDPDEEIRRWRCFGSAFIPRIFPPSMEMASKAKSEQDRL